MHRILLTTAATAALFCATGAAAVTINTDQGGFEDNSDNLTVEVLPGVTVDGAPDDDAIRARGDNVVITNAGILTTPDGDGIDSQNSTGLSLENFGLIEAPDGRALDARDATFVWVINAGLMASGNDVIDAGDNASVTNQASGTLQATAADVKIVDVGNDAIIVNEGLIIGTDPDVEGIETGDDATITNTGTIIVTDDALNPAERVSVFNFGTIEATDTGDGIDLDSGEITNFGTIRSANSSGIDYDASTESVSSIDNSGLIEGVVGIEVELGLGADPANTQAQIVANLDGGTITGTGGTAMILGAGLDAVLLYAGSTVNGDIDLGADEDLLAFIGAGFGTGLAGNLYDGGDGDDVAAFDFAIDLVVGATESNGILDLTFDDIGALWTASFINFENFVFGQNLDTFTGTQLVDRFAPPVPLPAAVWAMLAALGGLAAVSRRRA